MTTIDSPAGARGGLAWRLAALFGALFLVYGISMPYLPVWLDWRGLSAAEISVVSATPSFVRLLLTPSLAFMADRSGSHRAMVICLAWLALAAALALSRQDQFWPILAASVVLSIAVSTVMPLADAVTLSGVRSAGIDYGRVRLWGSVTFVAASALGGLAIERFGPGAVVWMLAGAAALTAAATHVLPGAVPPAQSAATAAPRLDMAGALSFARHPVFLLFAATAAAGQASHAVLYAFGTLHWRAQGIAPDVIGLLWAIGVIAEICLFALAGDASRRLGAVALLLAGTGLAVVRWLVMALDPPLAVLVPLQALHAASFAAVHLGTMQFIARAVGDSGAGTAQALVATVIGTTIGLCTLLAGWLYGRYSGGAYLAMAVVAGLGVASGLALNARWDGGAIVR